ncbi:hypothetical protein M413DRAFT_439408 [Hebeloma cylindrosporum]|uniref:PB1 domain-containing protein n=1 Tax=Hebeloma cylindrosporum TaxID=76867 RepID=A0A0C2Z3A1_HEBCY|nr:hypothetical protein M413DRAFT_439408 [Hebeloma cylindrosporum h7]
MPPIHFKLTKSDDHTRRATFQELPTWPELASKLQVLYGVPIDKVAVAYVDNDHDEITASSNEELQDFYQSSYQPGNIIKLTVLDLSIRRDNPSPTTPALNRNTFGQDNFEFVDAAWSGLTNLGVGNFVDAASEGPHAFVEVLSSDASGFAKDPEDTTDTDSENDQSTVLPPPPNKGKGKMSSFGAASTTSVVAEEASRKYPVHVFDHNSVKRAASSAGSALGASNVDADYIAAQSTPRVQPVDLGVSSLDTQQTASAKAAEIEDPPLPSLDGTPPSNASASLSNDVAALLNMFTNIISSHPELSEGVRNIVRNASNGTYWHAHRSSLSEAVNEMSQAMDEPRNLEAEASRRVSEALGGILRSFTQAMHTETSGGTSHAAQQQQPFSTYRAPPPHFNRRPWARRSTAALDAHRPWFAGWPIPPWGMQSPHGPPPPPGPPHLDEQRPHFPHYPPPPPPPPPHSSPPPPPPPPPPAPTPHGPPHGPAPAPPHPPPPPFHRHTSPHSRSFPHPGPQYHQHAHHSPGGHPGHGSPAEGPASTPVEAEQIDPNNLTGQLKLAKKRYKDIKEAIRQKEQDENERKKMNSLPAVSISKDSPQIVSHAWGSYPQLEMYSAPRRHNTHPGHAYRRGERKPEDFNSRAQARIARRLSDMGFTETSFPNLPGKIKAQMPTNGIISKEVEDDVVTTLLEDLLAMSSRVPVAAGSGPDDNGNSGTWN